MNSPLPLWQLILIVLGSAAATSFLLCALMRWLSPRIGYVDRPGGRNVHGRVVPMGGGVAIFLTFVLFVLLGVLMVTMGQGEKNASLSWLRDQTQIMKVGNQVGGILLGALILLVLGLFDDIKNFGPWFKLVIHFAVAALVVIGFGVRLSLFVQGISFGWIVSIFWIVVILNAFNFLDNADGLSAGVAIVCAIVLLGVALTGGQILVSAFLACLIGCLVGFLIHNFPPAKLFLGDAGSHVVGYLLAVGSLLTTFYNEKNPGTSKFSVLIPLIVMAIPLYDFISVVFLRWRAGASPFVGDHRHFSHRLLRRGLSPRQMVLTIYLACGCTAVGAIMLRHLSGLPALLIFLQTICIAAIIGILEYQPPKNGTGS